MLKFTIQIILEILLLCSLILNTFILKNNDTTFALLALVIFLAINLFFKRKRLPKSRTADDAMFAVIGISVVVIGTFYLIGFFSGFDVNYNCIFKNYIETSFWIKVFLIVLVSEIIRHVTIPRDDKEKKRNFIQYFIMLCVFLMVDITICTKIYNFNAFSQVYEFISLVVIQSIFKNIFLDYLVKSNGLTPCLMYRLLMDLYIYLFPVTPQINTYIEGVVLLVTPYIMYMSIESITKRKKEGPAKKNKEENKVVTVVCAIIFGVLVALVSREFEYAMLAIGSGSMTGTINKGDAVIYKAYDKSTDNPEAGDILVFYKENMIVVHRIIREYMIYGEVVYQTKGDANEDVDNWIVKQEDVIGVVKQRVPLIAWPSVKLNEWF